MDSLEEMKYDGAINEFSTPDCVICMDTFNDGISIMRIPTCRHFFHPHCCKKWFESKNQEDEQRCPQCNMVLKTQEMKKKKQENKSAHLISPVVKKSKAGSKIGNFDDLVDNNTNESNRTSNLTEMGMLTNKKYKVEESKLSMEEEESESSDELSDMSSERVKKSRK